MTTLYDVFVAHAVQHMSLAAHIRSDLAANGLRVWPESGPVNVAVEASACVVVLREGTHPGDEVSLAIARAHTYDRRIITVRVQDGKMALDRPGEDLTYQPYASVKATLIADVRDALPVTFADPAPEPVLEEQALPGLDDTYDEDDTLILAREDVQESLRRSREEAESEQAPAPPPPPAAEVEVDLPEWLMDDHIPHEPSPSDIDLSAPPPRTAPKPKPAPKAALPGAPTVPAPTMSGTGKLRKFQNVVPAEQALFATYYPKEMMPMQWRPFLAYVYRGGAEQKVATDAAAQLGDVIANFRRVTETALNPLETGAMISARPRLPGFQFNPPEHFVGFYEDWHRLDFKARATEKVPVNQAVNGVLTFLVEGIIVADVPIAIFVTDDPNAVSADQASAATKAYPSIFCSYSRQDTAIIERVERAYRALGLEYLRDVVSIRSGQIWNDELMKFIREADIFQLFWSNTAAESAFVRQEWEYALSLKRELQGFIRPVYWQKPMPDVPDALGHIHFAYEPELDE